MLGALQGEYLIAFRAVNDYGVDLTPLDCQESFFELLHTRT
jgi:hypothetical protein